MEKELQSMSKFYDIVIEFVTNYSFQILGAIIIFLIGIFKMQKKIRKQNN